MSETSEAVRRETWDQMLEADRLSRYYSEVANRMGKRERAAAVVTTAFAVAGTLGFGLDMPGWVTGPLIFATLVAILWPLVYRSGGNITDVILTHKRICSLHVQLKGLWIEIESGAVEERNARLRLRELSSDLSEVSGVTTGAVKYYADIRKTAEKETDAYWSELKDREKVSAASPAA